MFGKRLRLFAHQFYEVLHYHAVMRARLFAALDDMLVVDEEDLAVLVAYDEKTGVRARKREHVSEHAPGAQLFENGAHAVQVGLQKAGFAFLHHAYAVVPDRDLFSLFIGLHHGLETDHHRVVFFFCNPVKQGRRNFHSPLLVVNAT